jgi:hypothetical protein
MAETQASRVLETTTASSLRIPSSARAGTIRRVPADGSIALPGSTTIETSHDRTTVHVDGPSRRRMTSMEPSPGDARCAAVHPHHDAAASVTMHHRAARRRSARDELHDTTAQASIAQHHQPGTDPLHHAAPGRSVARLAVHCSMDAEAAEIQPNGAAAHAPATEPTAIAQHPATVTVAATGIVAMLSATAHPLAEPMCINAIGVLTDQATVEAIAAPMSAWVTRRIASLPPNRSTSASMRGFHRASTRGVSVSRAATVP